MSWAQQIDELSLLAVRIAKQEKLLHALRCAYFFRDEAECIRLMDVLDHSFDGCWNHPPAGPPEVTDGVEPVLGRQGRRRNRTVLVTGIGPDAALAISL